MPIATNRLRPNLFRVPLDAVLDYGFELSGAVDPYLLAGETIVSAAWDVPTGITVPVTTPSGGANPAIAGTQLIIWLNPAVAGTYIVAASFITSAGREDTWRMKLFVFDPDV